MSPEAFETLKTIIMDNEQLENLVEREFLDDELVEPPNLDRLKDGANLIDLYVEMLEFLEHSNADEEISLFHFWDDAKEILVDKPEENPKEPIWVFAECTQHGSFIQLLILEPKQLVIVGKDNNDGTRYLEYVIQGRQHSTYFIDAITVDNTLKTTQKY